jgi:soluble lytic murein transglycosylase-like protein
MAVHRTRALALIVFAAGCLSAHVPTTRLPEPPAPLASLAMQPTARSVFAVRSHLDRYATGLTRAEKDRLASTIVQEAARNDLPVDLVLAVMHVESRFHAFAVSPVGALGLMQLLPGTGQEVAASLGVEWRGAQTLFDPAVNVKLGVAYLAWLEHRYDRVDVALAAYNWGPGHIDQRLRHGRPLPRGYAHDVLAVYHGR